MNLAGWRSNLVAALLLASGAMTSQAQVVAAKEPSQELRVAMDIALKVVKSLKENKTLSKKVCETSTQTCFITIERIVLAGGQDVCVAFAPEVNVKTDTTADRLLAITWILESAGTDEDKLPYRFHPEHGILTFETGPNRQLSRGSASPLPTRASVNTRRDVPGAEAYYLPVVLMDTARGPELCAAIDPRIVNGS